MTATTIHLPEALLLSHSEQLRAKIELVLPELLTAVHAITEHPRVAELYPEYLIALHGMVRATIPLMRSAAERSQERARVAARAPVRRLKNCPSCRRPSRRRVVR